VSQLARNGYTYAPFITKSNAQKIGKIGRVFPEMLTDRQTHTHTHTHTDRQTVHIPQILQQKLSLLISGKLVSNRSKLKKYKYYCEPSPCEMPTARERGLYAQTNDKRKHNCLGAQLLDGQSLRGMANGQDQILPNGKRTCSTLSVLPFFSAVTAG